MIKKSIFLVISENNFGTPCFKFLNFVFVLASLLGSADLCALTDVGDWCSAIGDWGLAPPVIGCSATGDWGVAPPVIRILIKFTRHVNRRAVLGMLDEF